MGQTKFATACLDAGLTQAALAEEMNVSHAAVSKWARGLSRPHPEMALAVAKRLGYTDPNELFGSNITLDDIMKYLRELDRRELIAMLQGLPAFATVDLSVLLSTLGGTPSIAPEEFLSQSNVAISACWQIRNNSGFATIESILAANMPTLSKLATRPSIYQEDAALLAVQAKILQMTVATYKHDFASRKLLGREAVQFGEWSGDSRAHTAALYWQGDTYVYCYHQPQKAIPIFEDGLARLDNDARPNKTALCADLAIAYAQAGDENKAKDYIEQAHMAMPAHPVPNLFGCTLGLSSLDRHEGRMLLALEEMHPQQGHAKKAYDVFSQSVQNVPISDSYLSQTFIHKAEAAIGIGDLDHFVKCLVDGVRIAIRIGSEEHQQKASTVFARAPESWRKERIYQDLGKIFAYDD